jgi:predicted ester cyclase
MSAALPLFRNYDGIVPKYFQTFGEWYEVLSMTFDRAAPVDDYVLWRGFFVVKHRVTKKVANLILNAAWQLDENGKVIKAEDQFDTAALINLGVPGPTPYDNEVIATRVFEALNRADAMESVKTLFAENAVFYGFGGPQAKTLTEYMEYMQQNVLGVCSPRKFIIDDITASSTSVYVKHRFVGKHTLGPYLGIKPSGKEVVVTAIAHMVIHNGLIVETTLEGDFLGLMVQLGAVKM